MESKVKEIIRKFTGGGGERHLGSRRNKAILSVLLSIVMVIGMLPVTAFEVRAESYNIKFAMPEEYLKYLSRLRLSIQGQTAQIMTDTGTNITVDQVEYSIYEITTTTKPVKDTCSFQVYLNIPSGEMLSGIAEMLGNMAASTWKSSVEWQTGENVIAVPVDWKTTMTVHGAEGEIEFEYPISFDANGGSGSMDSMMTSDKKLTLPECTFTAPAGKVFEGWGVGSATEEAKAAGTEVAFTESKTVYAKWKDKTAEEYTISFDANGGSGSMAAQTTSNKKLTLPECTFTAPAGKEFEGWGVGSAEAETKAAGTEETFTEDKTVYAKWKDKTAEEYTISFDANGGTGSMASMPTSSKKLSLPECTFTAPEGKQFAGWGVGSKMGDAVAPGTVRDFIEDTTVYALWKDEAIIYNTVTFDLGGHGDDFTAQVASGSNATRPDPDPTASGYTFVDWFADELKQIKFNFSTKITKAITIYAKWSQNKSGDDDDNRSTTTTSKPAKTGTWDSPVTDGTWTKGSNGKWMYKTNADFKNTWGNIQYVDRNGVTQTGWFWFDANGYMVTGWVQVNGSWFYFDETEGGTLGLMKQGWITWNGNQYYLTETKDGNGGKMLANTTTPDGHVVDESGKMIH